MTHAPETVTDAMVSRLETNFRLWWKYTARMGMTATDAWQTFCAIAALSPPPQVQDGDQLRELLNKAIKAIACVPSGFSNEAKIQEVELALDRAQKVLTGRNTEHARLVAENERLSNVHELLRVCEAERNGLSLDLEKVQTELDEAEAQLTAAQEISAEQETQINRLVHELTAAQERERKVREAGDDAISFWEEEGQGEDTPDWVATFRGRNRHRGCAT